MKKYILGAVLLFAVLITPLAQVQAAGLSQTQIDAIIGLLVAFQADQSVIDSVSASLGGTPSSPRGAFCYNFISNFGIGYAGGDVSALDQVLNLPDVDTLSGPAFTEDTASAVVKFQAKYGIPQTGYVGPLTRTKLNSLYGCANQSTQQPTVTVLSPNGGERYSQGQTIPISFSTNLTDQQDPNGFNMILYGGGNSTNIGSYNYVQSIVTRWIGGSPYNWSIPSSLPAGNYTVYIVPDQLASGVSNVGLFDFSNNYFTVTSGATTQVPTVTSSFSPSSISSTGSTIYSYSSQGSTHCVATHPDGKGTWDNVTPNAWFSAAYSGSQLPNGLTTTITCYNAAGQWAASTAVLPAPTATAAVVAPVITSFAASPSITGGQSTTLSWSATGADSCVLDANGTGLGSKAANSSLAVSPTVTTTYNLLCGKYNPATNSSLFSPIAHTTVTVQATAAQTYTLSVSQSQTGTVLATNSSEILCGPTQSNCSHSYASGSSVLLTAVGLTGYNFTGWSGACSGTNLNCTVTMSQARSVSATFTQAAAQTYALSVSQSQTGTVISTDANDIFCGPTHSTCSHSFASGSSVVLTASPATGYTLAGWSGDCSGTSTFCTVPMSQARSVTATFTQEATVSAPTVTSSFSPSTISSTGSTVYSYSSTNTTHCVTTHPGGAGTWDNVTPNASFSATYSASQLPTDGLTTTQTCYNAAGQSTISTAAVTVAAAAAQTYTLSVSQSQTGTVIATDANDIFCGPTGSTCSHSYASGSSVVLTASAATGSTFTGWSGACSGTSMYCTVTMSQARSVAATFTQAATVPAPTITVNGSSVSNGGSITSSSATVSWASQNTSFCIMDGVSVSTSGSKTLSVTTHVLSCSANSTGTGAISSAYITVTGQTASAYDAFSSAVNAGPSESPSTGDPNTFHYVWNNNLQVGSSYTEDVKALQTALTHEGLYAGEISGGFYNQTFSAVKAFQQKYGIDTGTNGAGFVGLKTRTKLNTLY